MKRADALTASIARDPVGIEKAIPAKAGTRIFREVAYGEAS